MDNLELNHSEDEQPERYELRRDPAFVAAAGSLITSASVVLGIITEPSAEPRAGIIAGGSALAGLGFARWALSHYRQAREQRA